jgi:hypothetical protein
VARYGHDRRVKASVRTKSTLAVPNFGTSVYLPVKTVTICVPVHAPGQENPHTPPPARMRALEGGRDILSWVCVRGIHPHVWCVLVGTIPGARRLRVGRAEGRCLAAKAQTPSFLARNRTGAVSFARPDCTEIGYSFVWAKPDFDRTES